MAVAERRATVVWEGSLTEGQGQLTLDSSQVMIGMPVTWASRTEEPSGRTSPEELLAGAHAACYAMAFSAELGRRGTPPERLHVTATAAFDKVGEGFRVTTMDLEVRARVQGMDQATFEQAARAGEEGCPISNAIRGNVDIRLKAELKSG
jgi:osmotically inducible protein OsmC